MLLVVAIGGCVDPGGFGGDTPTVEVPSLQAGEQVSYDRMWPEETDLNLSVRGPMTGEDRWDRRRPVVVIEAGDLFARMPQDRTRVFIDRATGGPQQINFTEGDLTPGDRYWDARYPRGDPGQLLFLLPFLLLPLAGRTLEAGANTTATIDGYDLTYRFVEQTDDGPKVEVSRTVEQLEEGSWERNEQVFEYILHDDSPLPDRVRFVTGRQTAMEARGREAGGEAIALIDDRPPDAPTPDRRPWELHPMDGGPVPFRLGRAVGEARNDSRIEDFLDRHAEAYVRRATFQVDLGPAAAPVSYEWHLEFGAPGTADGVEKTVSKIPSDPQPHYRSSEASSMEFDRAGPARRDLPGRLVTVSEAFDLAHRYVGSPHEEILIRLLGNRTEVTRPPTEGAGFVPPGAVEWRAENATQRSTNTTVSWDVVFSGWNGQKLIDRKRRIQTETGSS